MVRKRKVKITVDAEDRASRTFAKIAGSVGALAAAVGAFAGAQAIVSGLKAATQASAEFESAVTRLAAALQRSGENTADNRESILSFASALQRVSLATNTQIVDAIAQAKAYGASTEAAQDLASAATDLAAATGVDLETAFRQVNRTLGGLAGELGETVPAVKELTAAELAAGKAADVLAEQFGGTGAAAAETLEGAINNVQSAFDALQVTIGEPLREAARLFLSEVVTPLVDRMTEAVTTSSEWRDAAIDLASALLRIAAATADILEPLIVGALDLGVELTGSAAEGLDGLASVLEGLTSNSSASGEALRGVVKSLQELKEGSRDLGEGLGVGEGLDAATEALNTFRAGMAAAGIEIPEAIQPQIDNLERLEELLLSLSTQDVFTPDQINAIREALAKQKKAIEGVGAAWGETLDEATTGFAALGSTLDKTLDAQAVSVARTLGSTLVRAAEEGSSAWDGFFRKLITGLIEAIAQALILLAINTAIAALTGGASVGIGAAFGNLTSAPGLGSFAFSAGSGLPSTIPSPTDPGSPIAFRPQETVLDPDLLDRIQNQAAAGISEALTLNIRTDLPATIEVLNEQIRGRVVRLNATGLAAPRSLR